MAGPGLIPRTGSGAGADRKELEALSTKSSTAVGESSGSEAGGVKEADVLETPRPAGRSRPRGTSCAPRPPSPRSDGGTGHPARAARVRDPGPTGTDTSTATAPAATTKLPGADALLALSEEGAISGGDGVLSEPPLSFWRKLADVLAEIFTIGRADTATFNRANWRDNAFAAAMAGGAPLRRAVLAARTPEARQQLVEHLATAVERAGASAADARGVAERMVQELQALYANPNVTETFCEAAQSALLHGGLAPFGGRPGVWLRKMLGEAGADADAMRALAGLLGERALQGLPVRGQAAILAQARHFPNATALGALARLATAPWLAALSASDQERAARVVGFSADLARRSKNPEQRRLLENTLDRLLPPPGTYTLAFADPTANGMSREVQGWADASTGIFHLNSTLVRDGTSAIADNEANRDAVTDTLVHEINHLVNGDHVTATHEYFMAEYGAWYTGFLSAHGRPPTRAEAYDRAVFLLTLTDGAYAYIRRARLERAADGTPGPEARRIIAFMSQFTNSRIDPTEARSADRIVSLTVSNASDPAPQPDTDRDMDN